MALEATVGDDGMVYIRETEQPDVVAVTTAAKWEAFVKGVLAGEFDHFAAEVAEAAGTAGVAGGEAAARTCGAAHRS
ncbi:hypothetical protein [Actinacidiphila bryophytorum]|uniref:DUF397 domain-containing protein n=1 Tax=Actinacidiphila bryophytorum TaxID=1436133 RepID=A0A9W4ECI2_9ACTN|nr:hypothetical protein [Actinacidiphila bryophytorum]CAG7607781.1 conserved hypothetical protein [Actinacidiphila bryophytorum]